MAHLAVRIPASGHFASRTAPLAILLASFALRVLQLDVQSLWYDETVSLYAARLPVDGVVRYAAGDMHPPLYNLLLHFWLMAAGHSEFAARFASVLAGMLVVALGYRLARDWFPHPVGLLAAALLGGSSFNLWYAQEARMYILASAGGLLSVLLFSRVAMPRFRTRSWRQDPLRPAYAATLALSLYTHYYILFLWIFQYAWGTASLALSLRRFPRAERLDIWRSLRQWHILHLVVCAAFAPWLPIVARQLLDPPVPSWRSFVDPIAALLESAKALTVGQLLSAPEVQPIVVALAMTFLFGLLATRPGIERRRAVFLAGATVAPLAFVLLGSLVSPLYYVRYVIIYAAPFYIVLALGIAALFRRSRGLAFAVALLYVAGTWYAEAHRRADEDYAKDGYRRAVGYLAERLRPGDAILINAGFTHTAFDYYSPRATEWQGRLTDYRGTNSPGAIVVAQTGSIEGSASLGWNDPSADYYPMDETATRRSLDFLLSRHARLWVLQSYDDLTDPGGLVRQYLNERAAKFDELSVQGAHFVRVQGYLSGALPPFPVAQTVVNATFDRRLSLLGWTAPVSATAGEAAKFSLVWSARTELPSDYRYSLGLFDSLGHRWAQADGPLAGSLYPASRWIVGNPVPAGPDLHVPAGTPPGDYQVLLSVYDPATGGELPVAGGTRIDLGQLRLARQSEALTPWERWPFGYEATFGDDLALQRHAPLPAQARPGDSLAFELVWRALAANLSADGVVVRMRDARGAAVVERIQGPLGGAYLPSSWSAGERVRDPRAFVLPGNLPDGIYRLAIAVTRDGEPLPVHSGLSPLPGTEFDLGAFSVKGREHRMQAPPSLGNPDGARFGTVAELVGYEMQSSGGGGGTVSVTFHWRALAPTESDYKVFVHLTDAEGRIVAQSDRVPGDGALPTTSWIAGEYVTDRHFLTVPAPASGSYWLRVGFYDARTGSRLPVIERNGGTGSDYHVLPVSAAP